MGLASPTSLLWFRVGRLSLGFLIPAQKPPQYLSSIGRRTSICKGCPCAGLPAGLFLLGTTLQPPSPAHLLQQYLYIILLTEKVKPSKEFATTRKESSPTEKNSQSRALGMKQAEGQVRWLLHGQLRKGLRVAGLNPPHANLCHSGGTQKTALPKLLLIGNPPLFSNSGPSLTSHWDLVPSTCHPLLFPPVLVPGNIQE